MGAVLAHLMPSQHMQRFVHGRCCSWTAAREKISHWPYQHCAGQGRQQMISGCVQPSAQQQLRPLQLRAPSEALKRLSQSPVWAAQRCPRAAPAQRPGRAAPARLHCPSCPAAQAARHARSRPARPLAPARWAQLSLEGCSVRALPYCSRQDVRGW